MKVDVKEFKPHPMCAPKTGKYMMAETMEEHLIFKELGLVHEDELDEKHKGKAKKGGAVVISFMEAVEDGMKKK